MPTILTLAELAGSSGLDLGAGPWHEVTQEQVNLFADATGDHQFIHVDPVAAASGPFGRTIAHGYLSLSLLPLLVSELVEVSDRKVAVNYGVEKVRFPAPVPVGSRMRLRAQVGDVRPRGEGVLWHLQATIEVEGQEKPALVGEVVYLAA